jgi:methylated-DNA-[protein]-cysteine S-methyltransferase
MKELRTLGRMDVDGASARAAWGLARRAEREGLVDVAFVEVPSPLGTLLAAATRRGLVRISFGRMYDRENFVAQLVALSPRVLEAPRYFDAIRRELDEYFGGERRRFEFGVDYALTRGFTQKVLRATARIPFGSVSTYREVAERAGNDRAYRAAGNALGSNPIPIVVPCHRVLHSGGGLGGYTGGLDRKRFLLSLEGVL